MPQLDLYIWFILIVFSLCIYIFIYLYIYIILLRIIKIFFYRTYYWYLIDLYVKKISMNIFVIENFYFIDYLILNNKQLNIYKYISKLYLLNFIYQIFYKNLNMLEVENMNNKINNWYDINKYNNNKYIYIFNKYIYVVEYIIQLDEFIKYLFNNFCLFVYNVNNINKIKLLYIFFLKKKYNNLIFYCFFFKILNFLILKDEFLKKLVDFYNYKDIKIKKNGIMTLKNYNLISFRYKYELYKNK